MLINLRLIDANPYRDFSLDPIDPIVVGKMETSIRTLTFWGGLAVRRNPVDPDRFQLAFGHHRLEALRRLGRTLEDLTLVNFGDDDMVKAMLAENALQRGGDTSATQDSVQAVIQRIAYKVLSQSDEKVLVNSPELFTSQAEIGRARQWLMSGDGVGRDLIMRFDSTLSSNSVKEALASLKAGARMSGILHSVQAQLEDERQRAEDLAADAKETKKREQLEAEAVIKAKQAVNAGNAAAAAETEELYDPLVATVFKRDAHLKAFRSVMTGDTGREYIPVGQHIKLAVEIVKDAEDEAARRKGISTDAVLTADFIKSKANRLLAQAQGVSRKLKKKLLQQDADARAAKAWHTYKRSICSASEALNELHGAVRDGGHILDGNVDTYLGVFVDSFNEKVKAAKKDVGFELDLSVVGEQ